MNCTLIQGILKMTDSFFVSKELKDIVTRETLSTDNEYSFPNLVIRGRKYKILSICKKEDTGELTLSFLTDNYFKINDKIKVESAYIFGVKFKSLLFSFHAISYNSILKSYVCEITVNEEKFWR